MSRPEIGSNSTAEGRAATASIFHLAFRALLWEERKNEPRISFAGLLKKKRKRSP